MADNAFKIEGQVVAVTSNVTGSSVQFTAADFNVTSI